MTNDQVTIGAAPTEQRLLIINAVECDPDLSWDDRLAQEKAQDLIRFLIDRASGRTPGAKIFSHAYELRALPRK